MQGRIAGRIIPGQNTDEDLSMVLDGHVRLRTPITVSASSRWGEALLFFGSYYRDESSCFCSEKYNVYQM